MGFIDDGREINTQMLVFFYSFHDEGSSWFTFMLAAGQESVPCSGAVDESSETNYRRKNTPNEGSEVIVEQPRRT